MDFKPVMCTSQIFTAKKILNKGNLSNISHYEIIKEQI